MTERFDDVRAHCLPSDDLPASVHQTGGVRSQGEALDDAAAILAFVGVGLASGAIDPDRAFWVVDLAPDDGERAWRVLAALRGRNLRGPMVRYLACCRDARHRSALSAHPPLQSLLREGRLALDDIDRWLRVNAPGNPIAVLAHDAISAQAQGLYRVGGGTLLEAVRDEHGALQWHPAARRDGPLRLLATEARGTDPVETSLPLGAMHLLAELLTLGGGRMLLRASDLGVCDPDAIRRGALSASDTAHADASFDTAGRLPVNFDALARWHRTRGNVALHAERSERGRVLHLAIHDRDGGRLSDCLPVLTQSPHPDDHVAMLDALAGLSDIAPAQGLSLLHALHADPRALRAMAHALPVETRADAGVARSRWRRMLERCRDNDYPSLGMEAEPDGGVPHEERTPR